MLADREAKEAAKGEVPDKAVEAALIPDGKVSIEDWNQNMDSREALAHNHFKSLEDAEGKFSVCLSCQNNPCQCGKSSPMYHFPYHDLMAESQGEEQRGKGIGPRAVPQGCALGCSFASPREPEDLLQELHGISSVLPFFAAKPVGEGDLDSQPTSRMGPLGDAEGMKEETVVTTDFSRGSSGAMPASAAGREAMPGTVTGAKPMREGDLDSQPTFRMEVLEDAEESLVLQLFPEFQCSFYLHIQTLSGEWEQRYRECLYPMGINIGSKELVYLCGNTYGIFN
ncbi:hypothetical protein DUI87_34454 [Hirundo rustica rustica]|uniref:Uncharacterized protein n=1 Tax=Hirundo rustica rustica TaxID=333673 RepID=A0A3M0ILF1_HIRRU|nr:hypothetical protein DUI87_34454 [Hirundo rustica rustica]